MNRAVLFGVALVGLTLPASAQDTLGQCATISADAARLACYDKLAKALPSVTPLSEQIADALDKPETKPVDPNAISAWSVSKTTNPVDDTPTVVAVLAATEGRSKWGEVVTLFARCRSNTTELYVDWGDYLGNDGDIYNNFKRVTVRVGASAARKERWSLSTDSKATFAPSWAGSLMRELVTADRLVLQTVPFNESPTTAIFDLAGAKDALGQIAETCQWQIDK